MIVAARPEDRLHVNPPIYFFLSYARSDDRESVQRFFEELSAEVRSFAGVSPDTDVGFLDVQSMEVGVTWSDELMRALAECRTFVGLISPRYLLSKPCGREWTVFADRLRVWRDSGRPTPQALLPLLWLPPDTLPPFVAEFLYHHNTMPEAYRRAGLRQLIRLNRHHDDYLDLISELARHIVRTAGAYDLPPAPEGLDYHRVPSVFHPGEQPPIDGAGHVRFVVAAPSRIELSTEDLSTVDRQPEFYGDRAQEWAPYRPELDLPVAEFARTIAEERRFRVVVSDIDDLTEVLAATGPGSPIVVLLVDPWATRLSRHRRAMVECDRWTADSTVVAVMVPAGHGDAQTQAALPSLTESLRTIFVRRFAGGHDHTFRVAVLSADSFDADLRVVLEQSRNRLFKSSPVYRRPPGRAGHRPILRGP